MNAFIRPLRAGLPAALAATIALAAWPGATTTARAAGSSGLQCTTDPANTFSLTASAGYISTPDGNSIFMWSYAPSGNGFQLPGPTLCVTAGSRVTVILHNRLPEDTSIIFPGMDHVLANNRPAQPQFNPAGTITSLTDVAAARDGSVTYSFTAARPGTYLYESGTDQQKQRQMGLYGALVVRPSAPTARVYDDVSTQFNPATEYVYLLSEVDPDFHLAVERNQSVSYPKYRPRYFLINGRTMPDTIAPNNAAWLPNQPYSALIHIKPKAVDNPLPAVVRYLNAGTQNYPFHPHGSSQRIIGRDANPLVGGGVDISYDKFLIDVAPGQTVDTLMSWTTEYDPADNPIPPDITLPPLQDQLIGPGSETWFSEDPYLGRQGQLPAGIVHNNQCGEYYHIAHDHALEHATNYGASFGGMMTVIRIDPPTGCPAP